MMNNPMMQLMQIVKGGGNPMPLLQLMAREDPQAAQFLNMVQGKSPEQLRTMATNAAKERGTTIEDVARSLGITIPSDK